MNTRQSIPRRLLFTFGFTSSAAVLLGAWVCALSGVPAGMWARNVAAWVVGAFAAAALTAWTRSPLVRIAAWLGPVCLAAALLDPGLEGVKRWIVVGPVRLNAAMLLLPAMVVATAVLAEVTWWWWVPLAVAQGVLLGQPDASQATALAVSTGTIAALARDQRPAHRWALALVAVVVAGLTWTRPDPLEPIPEVEQIIQLAATHSVVLAAAGLVVLLGFAAAPAVAIWGSVGGEIKRAALALSLLLLTWSIAPALGAFPTPLVGIGLSPILGAWLGVGLLASFASKASTSRPTASNALNATDR